MARITTPLTATQVRNAIHKEKIYKLFDGGGLYLEIPPSQSKRWRLKYRYQGKEKLLSIGTYPNTSLAEARKERELLKEKLKNGIDPSAERKNEKEKQKTENIRVIHTFEYLTELYYKHIETLEGSPSSKYLDKQYRRATKHCYTYLKTVPVAEITEDDIIQIIDILKEKNYHEVARRVLLLIKAILKFGVKRKVLEYSVAADISAKEEIGSRADNHFPIITDKNRLGELLVAINNYSGEYSTKQALKLIPYLAFRPSNIRFLEWGEVDFENRTIKISSEKMKMKRDYVSPMSSTIINILTETKRYSGNGKYVFPSSVKKDRPLSENTLNVGLRRLGYTKKQLVSHSFRGIFSTIAHDNMQEHGCSSLAIEAQLAHKDINQIRDTYNSSTLLVERMKLMQWWSDFLDEQKNRFVQTHLQKTADDTAE